MPSLDQSYQPPVSGSKNENCIKHNPLRAPPAEWQQNQGGNLSTLSLQSKQTQRLPMLDRKSSKYPYAAHKGSLRLPETDTSVQHTISKDRTTGEGAQQATLFAQYGCRIGKPITQQLNRHGEKFPNLTTQPVTTDRHWINGSSSAAIPVFDPGSVRDHDLYKFAVTQADGLFHCPWEGDPSCNHKPEKLKYNYDKFVDAHLKPYRCLTPSCEGARFSSTAGLLRHEREAHGLHGHDDNPLLTLDNPLHMGDVLNDFDFDSFLHDGEGDNQVFDFNGAFTNMDGGEIGTE